jgi:hypothetical protein
MSTEKSGKAQFTPKNAIMLQPKVTAVSGIEVKMENMGDIILLFGTNPRMLSATSFSAKRSKFEIGDVIVFDPSNNEVQRIISRTEMEKRYTILKPKEEKK